MGNLVSQNADITLDLMLNNIHKLVAVLRIKEKLGKVEFFLLNRVFLVNLCRLHPYKNIFEIRHVFNYASTVGLFSNIKLDNKYIIFCARKVMNV